MPSQDPIAISALALLGGLTVLWILAALACRIRDEIALHDLRLRSLSLRDRLELERLRIEGLHIEGTLPDEDLGQVDILDEEPDAVPAQAAAA